MALYGKWSSSRSCYAGQLLGGNCGLLSYSECTQKTWQNEQCLTLQCCTRRQEAPSQKSPEAGGLSGSQWFTCGNHGARGNQLCLGETCKKKSSVLHKSAGWGSSKLSSLPSVSARTNTWEECPTALRCCSTPSLDEARSWKVLTHLSKTTGDGNWWWKVPWWLQLEE